MDNAGLMRHIILVLIALIALVGLMPGGMSKDPAPFDNGEINEAGDESLLTTPSIAAFLNDSWTPSTFVAPLASQATGVLKNMTRNNTTQESSTYAIYDFLNDNYTSPAPASPIYTASAAGKDKKIAWTGESIYQFLNDAWTPSTPVETYEQSPFKMHEMN